MDTSRSRLGRRLRTVPLHIVLLLVATALLPVLFALALAIDLWRRVVRGVPFMAVRIVTFGWLYLVVGVTGLVVLLGHWLAARFGRDVMKMREGSYRLQEWWARVLFGAVRRIFRLTVSVEGAEVLTPGPILVMMRHASIIDTLLPNVFVTQAAGIRLHYVLKKELLADPTLDIAGNRLVNHFVDRDGDSRHEIRAVVALADGLGERGGVLIYPEGTRFTRKRRARVLERLGERDTPLGRATRALRHVLPPRPGGSGALLASGHDVVIAAHTGLEPLATIPDAWSGEIVGAHLKIRFWRFSGADIPTDRRGRISWLFDRWAEVDQWIDEQRASS